MKSGKRVSQSVRAKRRRMDALLVKPPDDLYVNNPPEYDDDGVTASSHPESSLSRSLATMWPGAN